MKTIKHTALGITHTFEIVDCVPHGYMIWNIGKNAPDGYIPLCRPAAYQPFHGSRNIDRDSLKAIKTDGAGYIMAAIGHGPDTLEEMENYIKRYRNSKTSYVKNRVSLYKKAIPIMRKIKGIEHLAKWPD